MRPRTHYLPMKVSSYSGSRSLLTIFLGRELDIILHNRHVQDEERRNGASAPLDATTYIELGHSRSPGDSDCEILEYSSELMNYHTVKFIGGLKKDMEDMVEYIIAPFPNMKNVDTECEVLTLGIARQQETNYQVWASRYKKDA
jgi:hypothetical protein